MKQEFVNVYIELWNKIKDSIFIQLYDYLDEFAKSEEGVSLNKARLFEQKVWGEEYRSVEDNVNSIKSYFDNRSIWLTSAIKEIEISTNVPRTNCGNKNDILPVYWDLLGRKKLSPTGVFIQGGRIYLHSRYN